MSRIGNREIKVPASVTVTVNDNVVTVKGPKGELSFDINENLKVNVGEGTVTVERTKEDKQTKSMHGTTNAIITNMIEGVSNGFSKGLEIIGVGYRFTLKGNTLVVNAGYSHPIEVEIPNGIEVESVSNTEIVVKGINIKKKHMKPRRQGEEGGIISKEFPIHMSKVSVVCPKCGKAVRIGFEMDKDNKVRVCKSCGAKIK